MATRAIVPAVASEEPQMAPKAPQPPTAAMATPPRRWPRKTFAAENNERLSPDREANSPMSRNMGITENSYEANCQYAAVFM